MCQKRNRMQFTLFAILFLINQSAGEVPFCSVDVYSGFERPLYDSFIVKAKAGDSVAIHCECASKVNLSSVPSSSHVKVWDSERVGTRFTRSARITVPAWNYDAYKLNELKVVCTASSGVSCFIQLQVDFSPFVDLGVKAVQTVNEGESGSIECPIRAPNFPPYKYQLMWSSNRDDGRDRRVYFAQNYTLTSYSYSLARAKARMDKTIYTCSLINRATIVMSANVTLHVEVPRATFAVDHVVMSLSTSWLLVAILFGLGLTICIRHRHQKKQKRARIRFIGSIIGAPIPQGGFDIGPWQVEESGEAEVLKRSDSMCNLVSLYDRQVINAAREVLGFCADTSFFRMDQIERANFDKTVEELRHYVKDKPYFD